MLISLQLTYIHLARPFENGVFFAIEKWMEPVIFVDTNLRVPNIALRPVCDALLLTIPLERYFVLEFILVEILEGLCTDKDRARGNDRHNHVDVHQ